VKLPAPPSSGAAAEARHSYYNSDWQELEVRIGASLSAERQYVWGRRYIDDLALRDRDADGDGSLEERLYGVQDSNWNVMALANPSTVIAERCQYTVFGRVTFLDGMFANSQPVSRLDNAVLYTGRELDAETGMYLYRMRAYGDGLGRFLGRDPLGFLAGDMNLYRYANGMPVLVLDPTGLWGWSTLGSFLTGVVIGAGIVATVAIAAPLVAAAGAALLVAAGVDAASAAILATGAVSGTLLVAGGTGLVTTGVDMAANAAEGNWDAVAFDAGTLVGGVGMGVSGGGRALAEGMMGGPSPAPNTWNLADILSYEWENAGFDPSLNDPNLSEFMNRMNWLATSPTPFSGGMAATGVAGGVATADDLIDQVLKACKP
jgi:RHS repeat-associated protein